MVKRDPRFERVPGTNIELLPSSGGSEGSKYGTMDYEIASMPEVRRELRKVASRAYERSQQKLAHVRARLGDLGKRIDRGVQIELDHGRIDAHLILSDANSGTPGAMSIEFGRGAYKVTDPDTGEEYEVSGMEGLGLLHEGFSLRPGDLRGTGGGDV